jgi:hypothetical protein
MYQCFFSVTYCFCRQENLACGRNCKRQHSHLRLPAGPQGSQGTCAHCRCTVYYGSDINGDEPNFLCTEHLPQCTLPLGGGGMASQWLLLAKCIIQLQYIQQKYPVLISDGTVQYIRYGTPRSQNSLVMNNTRKARGQGRLVLKTS